MKTKDQQDLPQVSDRIRDNAIHKLTEEILFFKMDVNNISNLFKIKNLRLKTFK